MECIGVVFITREAKFQNGDDESSGLEDAVFMEVATASQE